MRTWELWPHQKEAVDAINKAWNDGNQRVCDQLCTGGGKSRIIRTIVDEWADKKKVIYVMAHRESLVKQLSEELDEAGLQHGIIQSGKPYIRYRVQVCSMQTLVRRLDKVPEPSLLIIDEVHHCKSNSYMKIINKWPKAKLLGMTATPQRSDGSSLKDIFSALIVGPSMKSLIKSGSLSDYDYYAPENIDMSDVHIKAGEYNTKESMEKVDKTVITGNAIEHYKKYADHKPAIACCISIAHSEHVAQEFRDAGYRAIAVNSKRKGQVQDAIDGLKSGKYEILTQCDMLGEGVDIKGAEVLIGLRPTHSLVIYLQQCLSEDTEILTSDGWKSRDQVSIGDSLPALDMSDNKIKTTTILDKVDRFLQPSETMYGIKSPHLDVRVSNKHNMLVKSKNQSDDALWTKETAEKMATRKSLYKIPVSGFLSEYKGSGLTDSELIFLGWFLSDGTHNRSNNTVSISQSSDPSREWLCDNIREVMTACKFKFGEYKSKRTGIWEKYADGIQFIVSYDISKKDKLKGLRGWKDLEPWIDKSMGKIYDTLNVRELKLIIRGLYLGDGSKNAKITWVSHTTTITTGDNLIMCDRLQELCELRGLRANYYSYISKISGVECRVIRIKDVQTGSIAGCNVKNGSISGKKPYKRSRFEQKPQKINEKIWCVTNKYGTLITRRNGKVAIMGNCGRVLRSAPGKKKAIILDHVGNWERFGLPSDDREWSLQGKKKKDKGKTKLKRCPECLRPVPISTRECPYCGFLWAAKTEVGKREIEEKEGQLVSIKSVDHIAQQDLILKVARGAHNLKQAIKIAKENGFDHRAGFAIWTYDLHHKAKDIIKF